MTERPDPANIVASNAYIMDMLEKLARGKEERRINAMEAAEAMGFNPRYFHGHPWRLPNFTPGLYPLSVWKAWIEGKTDSERRREWDLLPARERARLRGAV